MSTEPQGWQAPKTNWQPSDPVGVTDFNRIEGNALAIETGLRTLDPAQVPTGNVGTLRQFLDWFANRLKAITGGTNWYDNPPATIRDLAWRTIGDTVLAQSLAERYKSFAGRAVLKRFKLPWGGRFRITGEARVITTYSSAAIYVVSYEAEPTLTSKLEEQSTVIQSTSYVPFAFDLNKNALAPPVIIDVEVEPLESVPTTYIRNVRVRGEPAAPPQPAVLIDQDVMS